MSSELLIDHNKLAVIELTNGHHWLRLALWLGDEFRGGELARFGREATISIDGLDTLSSSYDRSNWLSGVISGALYAFRTMRIPRQRIVLTELSGRLDAADMEAVAGAAAIAVSTLANKSLPNLPAEGWTSHTRLTERPPGDASDDGNKAERAH